MSEEEYAIVSKKEFMKLKHEIDRLKKNPLENSPSGENLQDSIDSLNRSLTGMMELFQEAADQLKIEERDTQIVSKKLDPIAEKVDTLIEQNQKIAKGIIAVADMVKEKLDEIEAKTSAAPAPKEEPKEVKKPELPPLAGAPPPPMPGPMGPPGMTPSGSEFPPGPPPPGMYGGYGEPEMMPGPGGPPPMPMGPPGPEPMPPGMDMPSPMGPPPADRSRRKPILGGFLAK